MTQIPFGHRPAARFVLTRDVPMSECHWLERDFAKGERVVRFTGATYGCIGAGEACSMDGKNPFFELPRDALERIA